MQNTLKLSTSAAKADYTVVAALIFTIIFWGLSFVAIKIVLKSFSPFVYVFLRFTLASCFFLFYLFRSGFPKLSIQTHKKLLILALFEPGLYFTFETLGLTYTTASKASIIIATIPIVVMVLARFMLNEKIMRKNLIGIILSFTGITILVVGSPDFNWSVDGSFYGDLLIIGAVVAASFYIVLTRDLGNYISAMQITSYQVLYGTVLFAPLFLMQLPDMQWTSISIDSILAIVFLSIFATIGGYLCYNYALTKIPASRASVVQNGIPVVTAVGAWIILGERLTLLQISGGLLALLAVLLANLPAKNHSAAKELYHKG